MAARTEADAMVVKFFKQMKLGDQAPSLFLQQFRDFRHELDMEVVERKEEPPEEAG